MNIWAIFLGVFLYAKYHKMHLSKHQTAGRDRMPVHLHPKTIDKVDADKRHHPGIDKRGSHAADLNIIGDQEIRLPYDLIDTSHNGIKRLYNQPH